MNSFENSMCFICGGLNDEISVTVTNKGRNSLIEASSVRNDGHIEILKSVKLKNLLFLERNVSQFYATLRIHSLTRRNVK